MKPSNWLLRNALTSGDFGNKINCKIKKYLQKSEQATVEEILDIINSAMITIGKEILIPDKIRLKKVDWRTDKILTLLNVGESGKI